MIGIHDQGQKTSFYANSCNEPSMFKNVALKLALIIRSDIFKTEINGKFSIHVIIVQSWNI